jgi:hypothetical protein
LESTPDAEVLEMNNNKTGVVPNIPHKRNSKQGVYHRYLLSGIDERWKDNTPM